MICRGSTGQHPTRVWTPNPIALVRCAWETATSSQSQIALLAAPLCVKIANRITHAATRGLAVAVNSAPLTTRHLATPTAYTSTNGHSTAGLTTNPTHRTITMHNTKLGQWQTGPTTNYYLTHNTTTTQPLNPKETKQT